MRSAAALGCDQLIDAPAKLVELFIFVADNEPVPVTPVLFRAHQVTPQSTARLPPPPSFAEKWKINGALDRSNLGTRLGYPKRHQHSRYSDQPFYHFQALP